MELNEEIVKKGLDWLDSLVGNSNDSDMAMCTYQLLGILFDTCKELTEENERLKAENAKYEAENHAEFNKWLKLEEATKRRHSELFEEAKIAVKEDTVRKMQERLKARLDRNGWDIAVAYAQKIADEIAKEMLEGL